MEIEKAPTLKDSGDHEGPTLNMTTYTSIL